MTVKIGIIGASDDPRWQRAIEIIQERAPGVEVMTISYVSGDESRAISIGYTVMDDWPAASISNKPQEAWQGKRRTPWRKRR